MGMLSVTLYIALAIALLLFLSHSPNHHPTPHHPHHHHHLRRLKLRSNFTFTSPDHHHHHEAVAFDPVVADLERKQEDKQWEKMYIDEHHKEVVDHHAPGHVSQPEWEEWMENAEEYLNDEHKFNVTNRLVVLFPNIDVGPVDGFVSVQELARWHFEQASKEVLHRTQREFEVHDKNRDGFVSFSEYEPPSWVNNSDANTFGYDMGWWKEEHFNASDMNGDGLLNLTEFNDFLHPADTKNPKLLQWLCKEEIRERDSDKDGKVNFNEFFHGLFDLVRNYDEEGHNYTHHSDDHADSLTARKLFNDLDKDGDGLLSDSEISPIIGKLHPSEHYYAKQQADYIISQADLDKDGRLSLAEMIDNPYVFYSTIFSDEDEYDYHDELR